MVDITKKENALLSGLTKVMVWLNRAHKIIQLDILEELVEWMFSRLLIV